jgi:hypothetical protein|nr:MAG TPA: hypothetical protein [Crassvirales sp.]DAP80933.1 MAG TPA: hypothetical protein [Crassvirales sp.]
MAKKARGRRKPNTIVAGLSKSRRYSDGGKLKK